MRRLTCPECYRRSVVLKARLDGDVYVCIYGEGRHPRYRYCGWYVFPDSVWAVDQERMGRFRDVNRGAGV